MKTVLSEDKYRITTRNNAGSIRKINQDYVAWRVDGDRLACVVCDGMGGLQFGDQAAQKAAEEFIAQLLPENTTSNLWPAGKVPNMQRVNLRIRHTIARFQAETNEKLIGTTLTGICLAESHIWISHIGDTKAFILRNDRLQQLTKDHNYALEKDQLITRDADFENNVLTRVLGISSKEQFDLIDFELLETDRIILCSDGLMASGIHNNQLLQLINEAANDEILADNLEQLALASGAPDNFCFAIVGRGDIK
jgi:PPM family protein phosphatase